MNDHICFIGNYKNIRKCALMTYKATSFSTMFGCLYEGNVIMPFDYMYII